MSDTTPDYQQPQTVSTDALKTLGFIITESEGRDAIHLAVENAEAGEVLYPAQNVGFGADGKVYASSNKKVGIVDPFLKVFVYPGQRFWLVVYPRQITSLRHVWEHPDFPSSTPTVTVEVEKVVEKVVEVVDTQTEKLLRERVIELEDEVEYIKRLYDRDNYIDDGCRGC